MGRGIARKAALTKKCSCDKPEWFRDGCVCNHKQAEEEDRHTKCCWDYNGKEKCPYREEDDDDDE